MLSPAHFWPSPFPIALTVVALLAFRSQPRDLGAVSAHPRFRTVDQDTGLKCFIGVRLSAGSWDALLGSVEALVPVVKEAKRDAAEAMQDSQWDLVHEMEIVVGDDAFRMEIREFAQYVNDLRRGRTKATKKGSNVLAPSRQ